MNAGPRHLAFNVRQHNAGLGGGIRGVNVLPSMGLGNRGLKIAQVESEQFVDFLPDRLVLRPHFTAQTEKRTPDDKSILRRQPHLLLDTPLVPAPQSVERGHQRRKKFVPLRLPRLPFGHQRRHRQLGLGGEKMIKTPFVHARSLTDSFHAGRPITALPNQRGRRFQQAVTSVIGAWGRHQNKTVLSQS